MYYNIKKQFQIICLFCALFFNILPAGFSQEIPLNEYGLAVIDDAKIFIKTVKKNSNRQMVELKRLIPSIRLDLRYAGPNNFTQKKIYPGARAFMRINAALALQKVQAELRNLGLGLKVFDAYRPYSATKTLWELVKDERYAANPAKGSGHNRGAAIDLTLINIANGRELDMPTGFDDFSEKAHHDYTQLPDSVIKNRTLLKTTMEKYGFKALDTEWWHYYFAEAKDFELLDISFHVLGKMKR